MVSLNLPSANFRIRNSNGISEIFDPLRRKFVALTNEEWVRQHLISFFLIHRSVPATMIASERGLMVNKLPKRFDLLIYSQTGKPAMIVECKAPTVKLDEEVLYQAARYNLSLQVPFLLISNGLKHVCLKVDYSTGELSALPDIPDYKEISG